MRKLRDRRGETLVETLCAVLVMALAVALLAAMLSASSRLDRKTDQAAGKLYQSFSGAEKPTPETHIETGTVSVQIGDSTVTVPAEFYGKPDQVVSYRVQTGGTTP